MNAFSAILLGALQGFTEFLPVSSSGHLVIAQSLIPGFSQPGVLFDVILHGGTLLAVILFFWRRIVKIKIAYFILLVIATLPAALVGYLFANSLESLFTSTKIVGVALLVTAFFNFQTDKIRKITRSLTKLSALFVGVVQAVAIIPGISRSGSTIYAGSTFGLKRKKAAEFSFLLSVPAVLGANVLQIISHGQQTNISFINYALGFFASLTAGYVAISLAISTLLSKKFKYFAYYCLALGVLTILFI